MEISKERQKSLLKKILLGELLAFVTLLLIYWIWSWKFLLAVLLACLFIMFIAQAVFYFSWTDTSQCPAKGRTYDRVKGEVSVGEWHVYLLTAQIFYLVILFIFYSE